MVSLLRQLKFNPRTRIQLEVMGFKRLGRGGGGRYTGLEEEKELVQIWGVAGLGA